MGPRVASEVAETKAQRDGAPYSLTVAKSPAHSVDQAKKNGVDFFERAVARTERPLRTNGRASLPGYDLSMIEVMRERMELVPRRFAGEGAQRVRVECRNLAYRSDALGGELLGSFCANAPEGPNWQRMKKRQFLLWFDDEKPIGFTRAARDLGKEFGPRNAHRNSETNLGTNPLAKFLGHELGRANDPPEPGNIEKGFVNRQRFDEGSGFVEDGEDAAAGFGVRIDSGRHADEVGAEAASLAAGHCGADAVSSGLIARSKDDSAADRHCPVAQVWVIALLDRGVERIEIGVQNICSHRTHVRSVAV